MKTSRNTDEHQGNHGSKKKIFKRYMQEKLAITVVVIMLALLALSGVLYRLVDQKNEEYTKTVLTQRSTFDSRTIPYRRGDIVDRNGTCLATSSKVYNVILDATQMYASEANYLGTTVDALVQCFGYDRQELLDTLASQKNSPYIRYERRISYEKKEEFEALEEQINDANEKADNKARVHGVWFEEEYQRIYPYNSLACNLIGFASSDGSVGNGGIEQYYNDKLVGTNGREYGYLDDESNREIVIKPAENGYTVMSTIDVNVQSMVERRIEEWKANPGSEHIGVIVMNPNNGEILAMADEKVYDLNNPRDLTAAYTQEEIDAMDSEQQFNAMNQMWRNFCLNDTYEPGSPSKVLTVATGLEENLFNTNTTFYCDGYQHVGGFDIRCTAYRKGGHGTLSLEETLMQSCNDAMMQMAAMEGKTIFKKYQDMFNIGAKTGIDLPGEASASTLVYRVDNMDSASLATNAFGQNYNCTMVQMAAAFSSAINGGYYYEPHVMKEIMNESGSVIQKNDGLLVRETVSDTTSRFLREALRRTVAEGTGKAAQVEGYEIGGKTGTAEKQGRNKRDYVVSFIGFAPADDPQVLVYVVIDQPHVEDQAHSTFASEVFSKIMGDILPYLNIFPSGDVEIVTPRPWETSPAAEGETAAGQEGQSGETQASGEGSPAEDGQGENGQDESSQNAEGENPSGDGQPSADGETEPGQPAPGEGTIVQPMPYDTEEYVPMETAEDGSMIPSDLPAMLPAGGGQTVEPAPDED